MTQQDDITQRVLTDDELQALWDEACKDSPQAPGWNRHIRYGRAIESALLSKLRAPVADERAAQSSDDEQAADTPTKAAYVEHFGHAAGWLSYKGSWFTEGFHAGRRAALASAPVAWLPERDSTKAAEDQGLFRKFDVRRTDGSDQPGGKHHGCRYFVLDVDHDPHASAALGAYAAACERTHPALASDLREKWGAPVAGEATPGRQALLEAIHRYGNARAMAEHNTAYRDEVRNTADALLALFDAAPQASAEDVRNAALEQAAAICDSVDNHANPMTARDCADAIRALKQPHADKDGCTCPSCDGSLRHPCPMHPGADKDGGQQRAGDDLPAFMQSRMTPWGLLVRAGRIILGTTLMDMSKALGMRPSELSAYECDRQRLTDDVILAVMRFFEERGLCIPATAWRKAALSAPQADGIRHPLPYIDPTREQPK